MAQVQTGDQVRIHYTGRLEDGSVFASSTGQEPLGFVAGSEEVIDGVSEAVVGMQKGETKTVEVPPAKGYGERKPELEGQVPRSSLPDDVKVGDRLSMTVGENQIPVWVLELDEQFGLLDANHPLAGKTLTFDIELIAIVSA